MKAFACRKCDEKFASISKLHHHIQVKNTKKPTSSYTSSVTSETSSSISSNSSPTSFQTSFKSTSPTSSETSPTASPTITFSPLTFVETSPSAPPTLATTPTISYADVIKLPPKLPSKPTSKSPRNSPVKSYLTWYDLRLMFRERKPLFLQLRLSPIRLHLSPPFQHQLYLQHLFYLSNSSPQLHLPSAGISTQTPPKHLLLSVPPRWPFDLTVRPPGTTDLSTCSARSSADIRHRIAPESGLFLRR